MELKRRVYSVRSALGPTIGDDVRIFKHGLRRYETNFFHDPPYDRAYGTLMDDAVRELQRREGFTQRHYVNQETFDVIWENLDAYRRLQYRRFRVPPPPLPPMPKIVNPVPLGTRDLVCQGLHATSGLYGNWAIDFCVPPGTKVLAVEDATIRKLSGHDPSDDTWDAMGVYGWSVHYETSHGYRYFLTHLGVRSPLRVGQRVLAGQVLGQVGNQKFRPDHLHLGVTSPISQADARARIKKVADAPQVVPVP